MASTTGEHTPAAEAGDGFGGDPAGGSGLVDRVVVIGSSAGGLDALTELLTSLPTDLAVVYVVAQHMAPDHDSHLVALLSRATTLPVVVATDGAPLVEGVVLVAPPHADITVGERSVGVVQPGSAAGPKPSIDVVMRSVAASWGQKGAGIVLSGTGSDGSSGLRAIRDCGGLTIAQLPETAQFDAMPQAAIATGAVDLVLAPADMGPALARTPTVLVPETTAPELNAPTPGGTDSVADVVAALHFATGLDFTDYKRGTLERQIARRQALIECPDAAAYCALVAEGGEEADALGRSLLVTVTSFFRDRPAWEALRDVLAEAWAGRDAHRPVRVWVPGCATGEEAYTAAMIVAEVLGAGANLSDRVKVFATDLSDSALEVARRGQYSEDVTATIPEHLRERWLRRAGADWQVIPALRDAVVFARHNVAQDPPFPHIDVVSLRNTLIYFTGPLQAKVLNFCHFALVPGGVLFLGQSERPTGPTGAFAAVDDQARIYRRSAAPFPAPLPVPVPERIPLRRGDPLAPPSDQRLVMRDALIDQFTPPALVVDANDDVIEVIGDVSPWCWVAPGQPSAQVVALLREELRVPVRSLLVQTRYGGPDQQPRAVMTPAGDTRLESRRLGPAEAEWVLLTFNPVVRDPATAPSSEQSGPGSERADGELQSVRDELVQTRAALQDTTEDLSASNEELRAMNEELQASAEELQASSEEVQATNEELQATNEELTVLNTELRERGTDLAAINDHLQNVQGSLTSGMIVVDRDLRVRSFTPLAVRLFVLIDADLGRPLTAVHPTVPVPDLHDRLRASVEHGTRSMLELSGQSADYLVAFQPYLQGGQIDGAIVVVTDITDLMATRRALADSENRYRLVAENATDVVWQSDPTGALVWVSPSVEPEFGWDRQKLIGRSIRDLIHPDDLAAAELWQVQLQAGASVPALEARALAADGGYRWMSPRGHLMTDPDGSPVGMIVGMRDIDEEVVARAALAHAIEHDPLTGLATLPVAITRVERLLADLPARPRRVVGVLCVGVDSLTPVNQALTHTGGDRVLLDVAAKIATVEHDSDLLARGSGDEFLVLLPELVSGADASVIAEDIRLAVHGPVTIGTTRLEPTVSIGIATGARGASADQLLRDASIAMRQAKDNGRDRCEFFQAELAVEAHHRLDVEEGMRDGLRQGQFVPWFQPIVTLDDGDVVGYEALVRWVRPDGSVVAPDNFLPVAERTALIADVDVAVLRQAVDLLTQLPEPTFVAVNVSAATLARTDYAHTVIDELKRSGADATRLHVEFTETALLHVTDRVMTIMAELAEAGVLWYVDDFGTGYSSISHLRDLPVAGLKLDQSFTAGIGTGDSTSERLAKALIGLADGLLLDTIAEGVETTAEAAILVAQGWKHAQGWLYGRPQPAAALPLP